MRIDILTLFPDMVDHALSASMIGRAREIGLLKIVCHHIRDHAINKHGQTDDYPYGGGMGMVMQAQPIYDTFQEICEQTGTRPHLIYMTPAGKVLKQQRVKELSQMDNIAILCGHYEGVDERVIEEIVDEEISIGDFVLTGGELGAMVLADAVGRLVPGVLADESSFEEESHWDGLLEYPQYTRPPVWMGREVPPILLSGNHGAIAKWRQEQAVARTLSRRPDMMEGGDKPD